MEGYSKLILTGGGGGGGLSQNQDSATWGEGELGGEYMLTFHEQHFSKAEAHQASQFE